VCVAVAFATDKRSHAWIRKTHSTQVGSGRNRRMAELGHHQGGCDGAVADSAQGL